MSAPAPTAARDHDEIAELTAKINRLEAKIEAAEEEGAKYNDPAILIMRQQHTAMQEGKSLLIKAQQREAAEAGPSSPPFKFLCKRPTDGLRIACSGVPFTLAHWRDELAKHDGPQLSSSSKVEERFVYVRNSGEILHSDADVEDIAARWPDRRSSPTLQLLTMREIVLRSPTSMSSSGGSKNSSPPRVTLPATASVSSNSLAAASTSSLDWSDPKVTLEVWLERRDFLQARHDMIGSLLDVHLAPVLADIVKGMVADKSNRYQGREGRLAEVQRLLDYMQGGPTFFM